MNTPPKLTDSKALARHRKRAEPRFADFLHRIAADEIKERQIEVNRTFTSIAIVTGAPTFWQAEFPDATVIPDDDFLTLPQKSFDLVIHAMSLHWANDPVGQLIQCRRALRADGLLLAVCFGGQTLNELRSSLATAEVAVLGGLSPRVAPMADVRDLGALIQRAGLNLPVADTLPMKVTYKNTQALMQDLRAMGEVNALADRVKILSPSDFFRHTETVYRDTFPEGDRLIATFELVFLTGWAPDESQQKPMRPGSAKQRLSDALRVDETSLDDKTPTSKD